MKLIGSTKSKITKDESGENVPYLKITEVVLIHSKIVNNNYHQNSFVLYILVPISPKNFIFLKTLDSEFLYIEVWSTEENSTIK